MSLKKEIELIILCSQGDLGKEKQDYVKQLVTAGLNWKEVLFQGIVHRVLNQMYYHLKKYALLGFIEEDIRKLMAMNYTAIGIKNRLYMEELGKIGQEFSKLKIRAVALKGIMLSNKVYPTIETRYFNDIDFLIRISDVTAISKALSSLGYVQGQYDDAEGVIHEATRKQKIFHQMNTHELQEFVKITGNPLVSVFAVDMNHSILWGGNCPYQVDNEVLISRAVETDLNGVKAYVLNHEDTLIQLCCHLYREATIFHWIKELRDLKLYKFADIYLYIRKYKAVINWDSFVDFVKDNSLNKIVFYTFYYVNLLYEDTISNFIMNKIDPGERDFLDEYGIENGAPIKWEINFFDRLFNINRVDEVIKKLSEKDNDFFAKRDNF